jgi:crotonobetainyl-CoA:carnitine CoA-transferase CaiB-like acyl-CoA transferase
MEAAQAETILSHLSELYLQESLAPGSLQPRGNSSAYDAPFGAYPCVGDDEWCAIEVRGDADWTALAAAIDRPELGDDERFRTSAARVAHRAEVDALVTEWTSGRPPAQAMAALLAVGVPAGAMARVPDLLEDAHLVARGFWRTISQPQRDEEQPTENGPAHFRIIADPPMAPAPLHGENSREVLEQWLALTNPQIDLLIADGTVETAAVVG